MMGNIIFYIYLLVYNFHCLLCLSVDLGVHMTSIWPEGYILFFKLINSFWLCRVLVVHGPFGCGAGSRVSRLQQLQHVGSVAVAHGLSCSATCGILVPQPETRPVSPALQGRIFITGPPGKSPEGYTLALFVVQIYSDKFSGFAYLKTCYVTFLFETYFCLEGYFCQIQNWRGFFFFFQYFKLSLSFIVSDEKSAIFI